ncbi:hypothetical protein CAPTEDRAFT_228649 [Capitella teleta]|uniref:BLOC-1-related complex subunit 8 homolog n=1 Tax=Capitella teleta TaxID=283909 RepID=R7TM82_CAPTE|nr:hypothetical protein CAPTEDRAFT_228649 [Capitella teleta]|eukprot:ELT94943.1 hypothetical protein CAPTEDRAFT_228649 [Capitella teleta]
MTSEYDLEMTSRRRHCAHWVGTQSDLTLQQIPQTDFKIDFEIVFIKMQASAPRVFGERPNPELEHKATKASDKFSENMHIIANEPSLAFYRIQEHTRKSLPQLISKKHEIEELHELVQGSCFDTEYAINAVFDMNKSRDHFSGIQDLLKNAMFVKQQMEYEQCRREHDRLHPSMYRSSMTRTLTIDSPVVHSACSTGDLPHRPSSRNEGSESPASRARSSSLSSHAPARPSGILR